MVGLGRHCALHASGATMAALESELRVRFRSTMSHSSSGFSLRVWVAKRRKKEGILSLAV